MRKLSRQQTSVTVSQLNRYVATLLEKNQALNNILVKGELSNVKRYASGHWYFNIKDENAQVACVMFKGHATKLAFQPRDGQEVLVGAKVSLYEPNGKYQLNVFSMDEVGKGNLFLAYEQRKEKLRKAGYFDEGRKKELPIMPKVIGVVTSSSGAVIRDIVNVSNRRFPSTKIILYPAKAISFKAICSGANFSPSHVAIGNFLNISVLYASHISASKLYFALSKLVASI